MAYSEALAERIRSYLTRRPDVEEKKMFGGICFMVAEKMCVGVIKNDLMVRIDPDDTDAAIKRPGARPMDFTHRPMAGYVYVTEKALDKETDLHRWLDEALEYNKIAKPSKKRSSKKK